jgi:HK97 family phage major capsid protein
MRTAIVLRKLRGRLVPFFQTNSGSFGTGAPPSAIAAFFLSPTVVGCAVLALIGAFALAWASTHGVDVSGMALAFPIPAFGIRELREKRGTLAEQAKAVLDKATAEKRELSAEETVEFDRIHGEIERLRLEVDRHERQEAVELELRGSRGSRTREDERAGDDHEDDERETDQVAEQRKKRYAKVLDKYLRFGREELDREERAVLRGHYRKPGDDRAVNESRTAQTVTTSGGGYLIPQGFSNKLEESLKAFGNVEAAADVFETETGNTLPWPTVDDTSNTGRLIAINTAATETGVVYGVVNFAAYKFSSDMVTVPMELLQDSAFDLNGHLGSVLGTRIGRVHNTYQTTGTGSGQPKGIVVGSSSGVTAAGTTTVTYDELLDLLHSVDPAYRNKAFGAGWMFNDGTFKKLKQMKDGNGRPLWQPGIAGGTPDTIEDFPYHINQDMAAMTTGLKPILFGALKKFKVRKVRNLVVRRLDERYAENDQVAYLGFTRMDSNMLDAGTDPCKYITMG